MPLGPVHRLRDLGGKYVMRCLKFDIPPTPTVCLLGNFNDIIIDTKSIHLIYIALCIAKKCILLNWKNRNDLNMNQCRDLLLDYTGLETASASISDQSLWVSLVSSIT